MTRKTRYWVCRPCRVVWPRERADGMERWHTACGRRMIAARTYPGDVLRLRDQERARKIARQRVSQRPYRVSRSIVPRFRLTLSRDSRLAFESLLAAKRKDSWLRRAQAFVEAVAADHRRCPHGTTWPANCAACTAARYERGGWHSIPTVTLTAPGYLLGRWRRGFDVGHTIQIAWPQEEPARTLIHELVHWLDSYVRRDQERAGCRDHDRLFEAREQALYEMAARPVRRRRIRR